MESEKVERVTPSKQLPSYEQIERLSTVMTETAGVDSISSRLCPEYYSQINWVTIEIRKSNETGLFPQQIFPLNLHLSCPANNFARSFELFNSNDLLSTSRGIHVQFEKFSFSKFINTLKIYGKLFQLNICHSSSEAKCTIPAEICIVWLCKLLSQSVAQWMFQILRFQSARLTPR